MTAATFTQTRSSKRAILASYEHAYAVAVQKHRETGTPQFVLRTGNPLQPFRVSGASPPSRSTLMTLIA